MLEIIRANAQSWGVKLAFGLIIVVFVFWGVGGLTGGESSVVIMVNEQPITAQDFDKRYRMMLDGLQRQFPDLDAEMTKKLQLKQSLAQQMILESLLTQEANRIGLMVTPLELRQVIETYPLFHNEQGKFDPARYKEMLAARRETPGSFEAQIRQELLMQKLQSEVTAGAFISDAEIRDLYMYNGERRILEYVMFPLSEYMSQVNITDAEVEEHYKANTQEYKVPEQVKVEYLQIGAVDLAPIQEISETAIADQYAKNQEQYNEPAQVKASHIILTAAEDVAAEDLAIIKAKIEEIAAKIKAGTDFAALAKEFSQDGSAAGGGELGWFSREDVVPAFADVAFSLQPGQISDPVRSPFGYHLIKVEESKPARQVPLDEVHDAIKISLATDEAANKVQDVLEEIQLATLNGKSLAEAGVQFKLTPQTTALVEIEELSQLLNLKPDQVKTILAAKPGVPLDTALTTPQGYLMVTLQELKPEATKALAEVSGAIKTQLQTEKANKLAEEAANATRTKMNPDLPADLQTKVTKTEPMGRDGTIPNLGQNQALMVAAFASPVQQWLPVSYALNGGFALLRVVEVVKPSEESYQVAVPQIRQAVLDAKREEMFKSFLGLLQNSATIQLKNERILAD